MVTISPLFSFQLIKAAAIRHFKLPFLVFMDALQLLSSESNRFSTLRQKCVHFLAPFSINSKWMEATNLFLDHSFLLLEGNSSRETQESPQRKALPFVKSNPSGLWSTLD